MRIPYSWQIEKVCSVDSHRAVLKHVLVLDEPCPHPDWLPIVRERLEPDDDDRLGHMVATDGRMMAVAPCIIEKDDIVGLVPSYVMATARAVAMKGHKGTHKATVPRDKAVQIVLGKDTFACEHCFGDEEHTVIYRRKPGTCGDREAVSYPKYTEVFPQELGAASKLAISTVLLARMAKAIGSDSKSAGVKIRPGSDSSMPNIVTPTVGYRGQFGIVMPMRCYDDD